MTYPRPEPWRAWPHERQIAYLEGLLESERRRLRQVVDHWLRAAERVRELEK